MKGFEFSGEKSNLEFLMGINKNKGEIIYEQWTMCQPSLITCKAKTARILADVYTV